MDDKSTATANGTEAGPEDEYEIRQFEPPDENEFRSLYETVFGRRASIEWFDWKYTENPYTESVPMTVTERDGRLVGARPFFTLPIRAGERTYTAYQPADAMVHPDHRRRGLFTRMTERALDWLADSVESGAFCFNFPNERSLPGDLKLGWRVAGTLPTRYRIERAGAFLGIEGLPARLATFGGQGFLGVVDAISRSNADIAVDRRDGVAAATLASLYEKRVPHGLHAHRTPEFYRWRFSNPNRRYATYTASENGTPSVAAVVGTGELEGITLAHIADVVPLVPDRRTAGARETLLAAIVAGTAADAIAMMGRGDRYGSPVAQGFLRDDRPPLSIASNPTTMVARPIGTTEWTVEGRRLTDVDDWSPSFAERDSG